MTFQLLTQLQRINLKSVVCAVVCQSSNSGSGDVTGPSGAGADNIVVFDGITGKLIKDGGLTIAQILALIPDEYILYKSTTASSITGTANETLMDVTPLIPGGTFLSGDIIEIWVMVTKAGTAGTMTVRVNVNDAPDLTSDTTIITQIGAAGNTWVGTIRRIHFITEDSQYAVTGAGSLSDDATASVTGSAITETFSAGRYFTVSVQLANGGDTGTLRGWFIRVVR